MARAFIAFSTHYEPFDLLGLGARLHRSCIRLLPGVIEIRNPEGSDLDTIARELMAISLSFLEDAEAEAEDARARPEDVSSE